MSETPVTIRTSICRCSCPINDCPTCNPPADKPAPRVWTPVTPTGPTFEQQLAADRARTDADPFARVRR